MRSLVPSSCPHGRAGCLLALLFPSPEEIAAGESPAVDILGDSSQKK